MLFKDLKSGNLVYLLDQENDLKVNTGKVINVTQPHYEPSKSIGGNAAVFVDVTVDVNGKVTTYSMSDTSSSAYTDSNRLIATDKDTILREVERIKEQDAEELRKHDMREKRIKQAEDILSSWNPAFKEKQETEKRMKEMDSRIDNMDKKLDLLLKKLE